jgi:dihydroorotase
MEERSQALTVRPGVMGYGANEVNMKKKVLIANISQTYGVNGVGAGERLSILIDGDGNIKRVDAFIAPDPTYDTIDATDLAISAGWVDVHAHVYKGVGNPSIDGDLIGPRTGVTVIVDAGSAGHLTYGGFEEYIVKKKDYAIFEFLNLGSVGVMGANDYAIDDFIEKAETVSCIEAHRSSIKGVKVRACKYVLKERGREIVEDAKDVACRAGVPLMVHIGEPGPTYAEVLACLDSGDIVTHCFHGKPGNILDGESHRVISAAVEAKERGVLFDVGHGAASFNYHVCQQSIRQGFLPDFIGTDLHRSSIKEKVISLPVTMSKMLACGLDPEYVVDCVSRRPRQMLQIEDFQGDTLVGKRADFTLFSLSSESKEYIDSEGNPIRTTQQFYPYFTIVGPNVTACQHA